VKPTLILLLAVTACATTPKVRALDQARTAHNAGDEAAAYRFYVDALCHEDQTLATGRAVVEVWAELGKPGTIEQKLKCKLPLAVRDYVIGLEQAQNGNWEATDATLAKAEQAAQKDQDRAEVAYRRGLVALERAQFDAAIDHLRRASGDDPLRVDVRLGLAQAQSKARLFAEAVNTLRGLVAIDVAPADLHRARRVLRGAIRDADDQLPDDVRGELQDLLTVSERGAVGEQHLVRVREILAEHHNASVLTVAGVLAMRTSDPANGAAFLNEAAVLAPLDPDPPRALGLAFYASDRPAAALGPLREAARRDPFDVQTRRLLADTASRLNETDVALEAYRALTVLTPREPENYLWVARLERKATRYEAARVAAVKGLTIQADNVALLVERAAVEAQIALAATDSHKRSEAADRTREAVDDLLAVAPGHPGADAIKKSVEGI